DEDEGGLRGQDPGDRGGGQLPDAVSGHRVRPGEVRGEDVVRGERRGDQQGLGHGGVTDLLGVRLRPVSDQVEARDGRPPGEAVGDRRYLEPWLQEAGGLSALAGRCEENHGPKPAANASRPRCRSARTLAEALCKTPTSRPCSRLYGHLYGGRASAALEPSEHEGDAEGEGVAAVRRG